MLKHGAAGATLFTAEERQSRPVFPVEVVDTVGAGDGFAAGLISAHLDGLEVLAALERAAAVGALATTSPGDKDGLPDPRRARRVRRAAPGAGHGRGRRLHAPVTM